MSHKDAPPETESQKACREWWEKARPTVKRAWGRAQDGSFLAEETRLIHQAWEAASQQANAEIERLRELCGMAYQLAGVHDAPEKWLDALSNAASGRSFSTDGLLPYMPQAVCNAEIRALELEREIEALRAERDALARENEAMKRCATKYLEWLGVTHMPLDQALRDDMHNPKMCGDAALHQDSRP